MAKCFSLCTTSLERTAMQKQVKDKVEDAAEVRETSHTLGSPSPSLSLSPSPSLSLSPSLSPSLSLGLSPSTSLIPSSA